MKVGTLGPPFTVAVTANPIATIIRNSGTLPSGVTFTDNANNTATLTGTPVAGTGGVYPLQWKATNVCDFATQNFTLTVNEAPGITSANATTFQTGIPGTFTVTTNHHYPEVTMTATGTLPAGVTLVDNGNGTATLGGTPAANTGGTYPITMTANNGITPNGTQSFTLTVNQPPAITSASSALFTVRTAGSFTVMKTGFPTPALSLGSALPAGVSFVASTGVLSGTPGALTGGTYNLTFTASNGVGSNAVQNFALTVEGPPVVSNVAVATNEDTTLTFTAANFIGSYSDPNSDALASVRITSLPANGVLKVGAATVSTVPTDVAIGSIGTLTFVPSLNFNGATSFGWNASDGTLFAVSGATVNITVNAVNDKPTFTASNPPTVNEDAGAQTVAGWVTNFNPGPANESAQTVVAYTVSNIGNSALFSTGPAVATNGTLTYMPAANANGTSTFQVRVQDNGGTANGGIDLSDAQTFTITVTALNDPPVITGQAAISTAFNTARSIALADLLVTDPDNSYPTGFTLTVMNGTNYTRVGNTITPAANFFGTLSVPAKVNDGAADSTTFNLAVTVNPDPVFVKVASSIAPEPGGGERISFIGNPGQTYTIQFTPALIPLNWQFLGTRTADATGHYSIVDVPLPGTLVRFYRSIFP